MSKLSDEWQTPKWLLDELNSEFAFTIDLCATEHNRKCKYYLEDLFTVDYLLYDERGFMNPPYSNPKPFIQWAMDFRDELSVIVVLVKADPSTSWWALFWDYENHKPKPGIEVRFLPKRVKFDPPPGYTGKVSTPSFPSAIIIFKKES